VLHKTLHRMASGYADAKATNDKDFRRFFVKETPSLFQDALTLDERQYSIRASVGIGHWASIPWLLFMDRRVTDDPKRGFYVVYLFSADGERIYLSLEQAVQGLKDDSKPFSRVKADRLTARLVQLRDALPDSATHYDQNPLDLGGSTPLAKDYAIASVCHIAYETAMLPNTSILHNDLVKMLETYQQVIEHPSNTH